MSNETILIILGVLIVGSQLLKVFWPSIKRAFEPHDSGRIPMPRVKPKRPDECKHQWESRQAHVRLKRDRGRRLKQAFRYITRTKCLKCGVAMEQTGNASQWKKIDPILWEIAHAEDHVKGRREAKEILLCQCCRDANMRITGTTLVGKSLTFRGRCPQCNAVGVFCNKDLFWVCVPEGRNHPAIKEDPEPSQGRANRSINL